MDPFWNTAIRVTGSVGVIGFLFSILIPKIFDENVLALFGSERTFYIVVLLICIFGIAIILAILTSGRPGGNSPKVTYKGKSEHHGDNNF